MAQIVATGHKMKSWQETTSLGQIVTVTAKLTISNKHFINTDTRRFKIQMGDMGPPLGRASYINSIFEATMKWIHQMVGLNNLGLLVTLLWWGCINLWQRLSYLHVLGLTVLYVWSFLVLSPDLAELLVLEHDMTPIHLDTMHEARSVVTQQS